MKKKFKIIIGAGVLLVGVTIASFAPGPIESHVSKKMLSASKEVAWEVISDVGNYHRYATGLSSVTIVSGAGEGMVRSCSDEQGSWQETCTAWDEGTSYSFDVDTGSGFPYPFERFNGTWTVNTVDPDGMFTELIISFEYQFPYRWMSWFFSEDTHAAIDDGNQTLIENWEDEIARRAIALSTNSESL